MKAAELQIGDIVIDSGNRVIRINSINEYNITYSYFASGYYGEECTKKEFLTDIYPIPLTSEILEKSGWKLRNGYPTEYEIIQEEYVHCYYDVKHKHCIIEIWGETTIDILLDCVHELQRALRCCGLWDLANNFKI